MSEINELYYTLKFAKNTNGNYTLLVNHPNGTPNKQYNWGDSYGRAIKQRDQTRAFVEWFRKTFPNTITEFKGLRPGNRYDSMRHFFAYEVTPRDFMLLKLSKEHPMQELLLGYKTGRGSLGYGYIYEELTTPSKDYLNRQKAIEIRKEIKELDKAITKKREELLKLSTGS